MSSALFRLTAAALAPRVPSGRRLYFQINWYKTGDYVLPRRDDFPQELYLLTGAAEDGMVVQSAEEFRRVPDAAGAAVLADARAWHWVDPVRRAPAGHHCHHSAASG